MHSVSCRFRAGSGKAPSLLAAAAALLLTLGLCLGDARLAACATPPSTDWTSRYAGPQGGNSQVTAMVMDSQNNIYVTGYSSGTWWDMATVKYSPTGRQLHVARYNGPHGGDDVPEAMALDSSGNVIVAGYTDGNGQYNYDYLTVKYDSTLTQQWVRTYAGQFNVGLDEIFAVATDPAGDVYVTGDSFEAATDHDYATIKYNASGDQLWVRRYNGPGNQGDGAEAIAVDADGNAYVTGISNKSPTGLNMDVATVKYSAAGAQLWARRYDGPAGGRDIGIRLVLDSSRNVYVSGASDGTGTRSDMLTIKYTQDGAQEWLQRHNGPGNSYDASLAMALAPDGAVCITGYQVRPQGDSDYATIKYSNDGAELWVAAYNGPVDGYDEGQAIAADADGNVYVTGYSDGGTGLVNYDYATVKYDREGTAEWAVRYNGPGDNIDVAAAVLLDPASNVIVSGWSTGTHLTDVDFATIRYRPVDVAAVADPRPREETGLRLLSAGPNPFREAVAISFQLAEPAEVALILFDTQGRVVRSLSPRRLPAGTHSLSLSGSGLGSGAYLYRLRAGAGVRSGSITLVR